MLESMVSDNGIFFVSGEVIFESYSKKVKDTMLKYLNGIKQELSDESKLTMVCGPILFIPDNYKNKRMKGSIIYELRKELNFRLLYSEYRQREHFKLFGNMNVIVEGYHLPHELERKWVNFNKDPFAVLYFSDRAKEIIKDKNVKKSINPENEFLFLTLNEIKKLYKEVENRKLDYHSLNKIEFEKILKELN